MSRITCILISSLILSAAILGVAACTPREQDDSLVVVTTFTVLQDFATRVVGDRAEVRNISPVGAEVHEWELVPTNFADIEDATLVFYNGYNVEQWMSQVRIVAGPDTPVIPVAEDSGLPTLPIQIGTLQGETDPHLWMDPRKATAYLEVIRDAMIEIDPEGAATYRANTTAAANEFQDLYEELQELLAAVPTDRRLLISSEAAFLYFADAFGFEHSGIWGTNTEEEGTPQQLARITDLIRNRQLDVIFYESTGSDRHARSTAGETGVSVAGPLYVDSVDEPGSGIETYPAMLRQNARLLLQHLGQED